MHVFRTLKTGRNQDIREWGRLDSTSDQRIMRSLVADGEVGLGSTFEPLIEPKVDTDLDPYPRPDGACLDSASDTS